MSAGLLEPDKFQPTLVGFAKVNRDFFHSCGNDEQLGAQIARQQAGRKVLVDYRLQSLQLAVRVAQDRDAAAAAGNDDVSEIDQRLDNSQFDNFLRPW